MNPVAFTIFGQEIMWYGVLITTAMVLGVTFSAKIASGQGFKGDDFIDIALFVLPVSIICARAYYVVFNLELYDSFLDMINTRLGGMAIHGGLIGGVVTGFLVTRVKKMNFFKAADIFAPFLALGQSIGRWGNYINQEAYGRPTDLPWAIMVDGLAVHPTFLYESIWDFLIFILLFRKLKSKKYDGQLMAAYLILYSVGRFFIEGLRTDSLMLGGLRAAQIASLAMILLGLAIVCLRRDKGLRAAYWNTDIGSNYYFAREVNSNMEKKKKDKKIEAQEKQEEEKKLEE